MPRILVADDNTNIQKMVALAFEERGIDVVSVGNGEAAVRRIPDLAPDLVLADVFMPVRNGYEVCEFVKKDERFSHVPVILLVGAFDPLDEKEARRVGADGVLKKPFIPPDPLIAMVTSALEKNPKLAAEIAKTREVPDTPPEPAAPAIEPPALVQSRPLPEFPEPTPEEAAAIYGFGKGRSTEEEPPAPKEEAQEEEDFDGSSTSNDWRRNAADFEVPKEIGAFTPGESFDSTIFPSERDLPPQHVAMTEQKSTEPPTDALPRIVAPTQSAAPVASESQTAKTPEGNRPSTPDGPAPTTEAAVEAKNPPADEPESTPKPKPGTWLDMFASPGEYGDGGWMSTIFSAKRKAEPQETKAENAPGLDETAATPLPPVVAETDSTPASTGELSHEEQPKSDEEEQFFAKSTPAKDSWPAPPPPPVLPPVPETSHGAFMVSTEPPQDLLAAPADAPAVQKDPDLEEPATPHITPEPLLVDEEEPKGESAFSGTPERPEPLYEVTVPEPSSSADELPSEDPAVHEALSGSIFAPADAVADVNPGDERIPTVPPPNREALANIPFLTPPAAQEVKSSSQPAATPVDTDAIVAKLLEKLEPQLHEVLAQGLLKPLVENLLREELENKAK